MTVSKAIEQMILEDKLATCSVFDIMHKLSSKLYLGFLWTRNTGKFGFSIIFKDSVPKLIRKSRFCNVKYISFSGSSNKNLEHHNPIEFQSLISGMAFCSNAANDKINRAHKPCLRVLYEGYESSFQKLLSRDNSQVIHVKNLQKLITDI